MNANRILLWTQVITGIAVLAGLVLVLLELRQARELAYAESIEQFFNSRIDADLARLGETPTASVYVKGCLSPEKLTDEEVFIFETLVRTHVDAATRTALFHTLGGFDQQWEYIVRIELEAYLGTKIGRADWERNKAFWTPELFSIAESIIDEGTQFFCKDHYERLIQVMRTKQVWWEDD